MKSESSPIDLGAPFCVERVIAHGASSTVYEALNEKSGERVALKVFHTQLTEDAQFVARLQREADALKQIQHPNVVRLIQPWTHNGRFFLELELVQGRTLKQWMRDEPADWIEPRLWLLVGLARALGAAHQEQFIHRDLKPENILISEKGVLKLTDFGLAKAQTLNQRLTQTGSLVGSLAYMAPETVEGKKATFASDIFSFGVVAYELVCGQHPFFDSQEQLQVRDLLLGKFSTPAARNPRVPLEISELIEICMHKEASARPASIWRVESQLMEHLHDSGLLNLAKRAVETAGAGTSLLPAALERKHEQLKSDIAGRTQNPSCDRKRLVARINEFGAHFPNDGSLPGLIEALAAPEKKKARRWPMAITMTALAVGFVFVALKTREHLPADAPHPAAILKVALPSNPLPMPPSPSEAPAPAAPQVNTERRVIKEPKLPAIKPKFSVYGTLRVITDPEVRAFVNGKALSREDMSSYRLHSGTHILRLEKKGFLPIEKPVTITGGKITTVNTEGTDNE